MPEIQRAMPGVPNRSLRSLRKTEYLPGFGDTAAYFDARACKARDDEKERLLDAAKFYRSLARIISSFPPAFKPNGATLSVASAGRWVRRAELCRRLADCIADAKGRGQMQELADSYNLLAKSRGELPRPLGSSTREALAVPRPGGGAQPRPACGILPPA
jgi:hypothetical protein